MSMEHMASLVALSVGIVLTISWWVTARPHRRRVLGAALCDAAGGIATFGPPSMTTLANITGFMGVLLLLMPDDWWGGGRRRLVAARLKVREYLARGIPARRPVPA